MATLVGFLNINSIDNLGQIVLCCGGSPGHYAKLSSILDLYSLDISSPVPPGFPSDAMVKNLPANAGDTGDTGLIPGLGTSWRREWQPTPVSCLENSMDRGAWWATVQGLAKGWT